MKKIMRNAKKIYYQILIFLKRWRSKVKNSLDQYLQKNESAAATMAKIKEQILKLKEILDKNMQKIFPKKEGEANAEGSQKEKISKIAKLVLIPVLAYLILDSFVFTKKNNQEQPTDNIVKEEQTTPPAEERKISQSEEMSMESDYARPAEEDFNEPDNSNEMQNESLDNNAEQNDINNNDNNLEDSSPQNESTYNNDPNSSSVVNEEKNVEENLDNASNDQLNDTQEQTNDSIEDTKAETTNFITSDPVSNEPIVEEKATTNNAPEYDEASYNALINYDDYGRGLVYNCKDRHWACVSKKSYFKCRNHERSARYGGKVVNCSVRNVYATNDDCRIMQKYYVNNNSDTDFCE